MQQQDNIPLRKKPLSGAQRRKLRVARGEPRYTPNELAAKYKADRARTVKKNKRAYGERSALIDAIKLERGCADCGYKASPVALQFDHLPGFEKVDTITRLVWHTHTQWDIVLAEIDKCEVVCANCHAIRTHVTRKPPAVQ